MFARTSRSQLFLGVAFLTLTTIAHAVSVSAIKVESKTSSTRSPAPAPVLEPGTRLFVDDSKKNEFYILRADQPNPEKKSGPVFVNTQPLQAGMDADNLLAQPADTIDVNHILDDQADDDITSTVMIRYAYPDQAVEQTEQAIAESKPVTNPQPLQTSIDSKMRDKEQSMQTHDNSNLSKVKMILHKMTRKMAVKKVHSRLQVAYATNHRKLAHIHRQSGMKSVGHAVAERHVNTKFRSKTQLAVMKVKYIHLG